MAVNRHIRFLESEVVKLEERIFNWERRAEYAQQMVDMLSGDRAVLTQRIKEMKTEESDEEK